MAPVFEYVSLNEAGKKVKGVLDAEGPVAARTQLRTRGLRPIELAEVAERRAFGRGPRLWAPRVSAKDVSLIMRRFATLLNSGLPLVESLEAILEQSDKPAVQKTLRRVRERVLEGTALWQAMAEHPRVFGELQVNMVRSGETSGNLELVLLRLADLMEAAMDLRNRVRAALAYPVFMFLVGAGVVLFILTFVMPQITDLFRETGQKLPWPTVILIQVSALAHRFWWIGALAVVCGVVAWKRFARTPKGRLFRGKAALRLPLVGGLTVRVMVARFARTMGALLRSGVPMMSALRVARSVVGNPVYADAIAEVETRVGEGASLSDPLKQTGLFPPVAIHMIHSGEKSGALEDMMARVADSYEKEVSSAIGVLMSMLEPIMILGMGLAVGFIVLAVLLPILEMSQGIR